MATAIKTQSADSTKKQRKQPATFESVLASLHKTDRILSKKFAETDRKFEKSRIAAEKSRIEADRRFEKSRIEAEKRMKKLEELMGSWS